MKRDDRILVTGATGLAGINLVEHLRLQGFGQVIAAASKDCDLTDRTATQRYFKDKQPAYVFHMAGFVRGIAGNMRNQGQAYLDNLLINTNVVDACRLAGVNKILAMGTVAMYPDPLPGNPLSEDMLWQGLPHSSERGYAQAKRAMLAQLDVYREAYGLTYAFAISTNLYGPHDRFNLETGHVIPSLVRKFYEAKKNGGMVSVWSDGSPQRDFLYIKEAARGLQTMMEKIEGAVNLASGTSRPIRDVVTILAKHTGLEDRIVWQASEPSGQTYRAYNVQKLTAAGFSAKGGLEQDLISTYDWYATHEASARKQ